MKKLILLLIFSLLTFFIQAQVLRVATTPTAIASQIPGYTQVSTINVKTISYTPSTPTTPPTPVDEDSTTEDIKVYDYADVITANITTADGNVTSTSLVKCGRLK
jgi:hypothetical protein